MREEYTRERKIIDKTERDEDMIDYYTYELKANQSKLDYLIKFAKNKGISLDMIESIKMKLYMQSDEVV